MFIALTELKQQLDEAVEGLLDKAGFDSERSTLRSFESIPLSGKPLISCHQSFLHYLSAF